MRGPYMGAGAGILAIAARHDLSMSSIAAREQQAGLSAAGDSSISAPFSLAAQQQQLMGARDATASRAIGGSLTAGAGLAAGLAFGGPAGMAVAAIGGALTELFATKQEQEGATKAAALGAAGQAISFRAQVAGRRANFDQQNSLLGMYGRGISPGAGAGLGLLPEESMSAMLGFAGAAGFDGALDGQQVLRMSRSSVGIGTAGAFRGLGAAGAGGTGDVNPSAFIALAQQSGLMGSKADEYLSRIASATSSLAEQGMHLDIGETDKFLRMLSGAEGAGNFSGLAQSRAVGQLTGSASGARGRILAPYQGMTENAVLMQALQSGGGSTMGSLRALEGIMSSPTRIAGATMGVYGGMAPLGFAAAGMSSDVAQAVAGMSPDNMTSPGMRVAGGSGLAIARAKAQAGLMDEIGPGDAAIFDAEARIQKRVLALGGRMLLVIDKLEQSLEKLYTKVVEVIEETSF